MTSGPSGDRMLPMSRDANTGAGASGHRNEAVCKLGCAYDIPRDQVLDDAIGHLVRLFIERPQMNLRLFRRLIGRVEAGEVLDRAGLGLGVQALGIAPHAFLDRRIDKDLDEFAVADQIPHHHRARRGRAK